MRMASDPSPVSCLLHGLLSAAPRLPVRLHFALVTISLGHGLSKNLHMIKEVLCHHLQGSRLPCFSRTDC